MVLLVSDIHHVEMISQNISHSCSQKCCLLRGKIKSQSSRNKAWIVSDFFSSRSSSFSFPLPSLWVPLLLLFQLLLHFPFILSISASSEGPSSLSLGVGGGFPVLCLHCCDEKIIALFISCDITCFLVFRSYTQCLPLSSESKQYFPASRRDWTLVSAGYLPVGLVLHHGLICPGRLSRRLSSS